MTERPIAPRTFAKGCNGLSGSVSFPGRNDDKNEGPPCKGGAVKRLKTRMTEFWAGVRRPAMMFLVGMALAGPSSAFLVRQRAVAPAPSVGTDGGGMDWSTADLTERRASLTLRLAQLFDVPLGLATEIHAAAEQEGIPARLAFGLVRTESSFKRTAVSPVGAVGYTQLMPATARLFEPGLRRRQLFDPATNLHVGFRYLHELMVRYNGDVRLALTAYNRGPDTVDRLVSRGRDPENGYADLVLRDPATERTSGNDPVLMTAQRDAAGSKRSRRQGSPAS